VQAKFRLDLPADDSFHTRMLPHPSRMANMTKELRRVSGNSYAGSSFCGLVGLALGD